MNDTLERSRPMEAYAESYGEPDMETTSRMRSRILDYMEDRAAGRQRWRHWVQAVIAVCVIGAGAAGVWSWSRDGEPVEDARAGAGVIATVEQAQEVELEHAGTVRLLPHSGIRIRRDTPDAAVIELLEGEIEVRVDDAEALDYRIDTGDHEVEVHGSRVGVRRTRGVPLVTVYAGYARLHGPDLPAEGVRIVPAQ